jgi:very-short-patch-repair endonuclease
MDDELSTDWQELLGRQAGIVTRGQAVRCGMSDYIIERRLGSGRWRAWHYGVYATFSGPLSREAALWAVVLRAGRGAVLSHETAAELLGLADGPSDVIHVTVPGGRHPGPIHGAAVHQSRRAGTAAHPVQVPPRTRVEETVLDLTQTAPTVDAAYDWLGRGVGRRLTTATRLRAALDARPKMRWRAELASAMADTGSGLHSLLEYRYVHDVEQAHGLPPARRQARITTGSRSRFADNLYEQIALAIELDGQIAHAIEHRWTDIHRDNDHAALGITTLRYSWADVTERPCAVAQQVAATMQRLGAVISLRACGPGCGIGICQPYRAC